MFGLKKSRINHNRVHAIGGQFAFGKCGKFTRDRGKNVGAQFVRVADRVRRQYNIVKKGECIVGRKGLRVENVEPRCGDAALGERLRQSNLVNDRSAADIDQNTVAPHQAEFARTNHAMRFGRQRRADYDEMTFLQQTVEGCGLSAHALRARLREARRMGEAAHAERGHEP
jgi:hypothetical protein